MGNYLFFDQQPRHLLEVSEISFKLLIQNAQHWCKSSSWIIFWSRASKSPIVNISYYNIFGSGCSWSLPVCWVLKLESLSFFSPNPWVFPRALEFIQKTWSFRASFLKERLFLVENWLKMHQIWHFLARFARIEALFAHLQQKCWK